MIIAWAWLWLIVLSDKISGHWFSHSENLTYGNQCKLDLKLSPENLYTFWSQSKASKESKLNEYARQNFEFFFVKFSSKNYLKKQLCGTLFEITNFNSIFIQFFICINLIATWIINLIFFQLNFPFKSLIIIILFCVVKTFNLILNVFIQNIVICILFKKI